MLIPLVSFAIGIGGLVHSKGYGVAAGLAVIFIPIFTAILVAELR